MTVPNSSKLVCAGIALVLLGLISMHFAEAEEAESNADARNSGSQPGTAFMRAKLKATHKIVDGLAFEDFDRIEAGADELLRFCELSSWKVRRDPVYMHYAGDLARTTTQLRDAARAKSLEKSTFAYIHLTVSCAACHRHVRNVIQIAPAPAAKFQTGTGPIFR